MEQNGDPQQARRESLLTFALTALFGGGFLVFLILISGGFFFYVVTVVAAMGVIGTFHYLLWGKALSQEVATEREQVEQQERREAEREELSERIRARRR